MIDVAIPAGLTVGYIMGVGDQVPAALQQLGARVTLIDSDEMAWGDLSRYHAIVTGVRAYERRADLRANNHRLLKYVEDGGTAIVQYNRTEFNQAQYGPYPARTSTERITDENAPVKILVPGHPAFSVPNKLNDARLAGMGPGTGHVFPRASRSIRNTSISSRWRIRSSSTRARSEARSSRPDMARDDGCTSGWACGGSCRRARTAPTVCSRT